MEILDVLNENGEIIGKEERKKVHEEALWHIHVGAWIMNEKGELLLQKRSMLKKVNPGLWTRTGGHVDSGETPETGIQREVEEEIGLSLPEAAYELLGVIKENKFYPHANMINRVFIYSYFALTNRKIEEFVLQEEEVAEVKYITIEEMEELYRNKDARYTFSRWEEDVMNETFKKLRDRRDKVLNA